MENGPRMRAKEGAGCKCKKLRNPKRNGKKILLKWKRAGLWFKHSPLFTSNQQPSKSAPAASSSHYKLEVKIAV